MEISKGGGEGENGILFACWTTRLRDKTNILSADANKICLQRSSVMDADQAEIHLQLEKKLANYVEMLIYVSIELTNLEVSYKYKINYLTRCIVMCFILECLGIDRLY